MTKEKEHITTTMRITKQTRKKLWELKEYGETYDDFINHMMELHIKEKKGE